MSAHFAKEKQFFKHLVSYVIQFDMVLANYENCLLHKVSIVVFKLTI